MFSKNIIKLQDLSSMLYFTIENAADVLGIQKESASVFCSRYTKAGLLVKLKNNFYISAQKLNNISSEEVLAISNFLQVPSYISFMTALEYYGITTQVQRDYIENASVKRTVEYDIKGINFRYCRLNKKYYFDFIKRNGIFIASKEKAFLDSVYLYSFGKYKLDFSSLYMNKLDIKRLLRLLKTYPEKTKKIVRKLCRT